MYLSLYRARLSDFMICETSFCSSEYILNRRVSSTFLTRLLVCNTDDARSLVKLQIVFLIFSSILHIRTF